MLAKDHVVKVRNRSYGTVGYQIPDEECDLNYCKEAVEAPIKYALSNSLGFGGHNATLVVRKYEEV